MKFLQFLIILISFYQSVDAKYHNNVFSEELVIKELNNDFVNTYFQFTTQWNYKTNENDRKKTLIIFDCFDFLRRLLYFSLTHGFNITIDLGTVFAL